VIVKQEWITRLQRLTGCETDTIRWNGTVHRFEFVLRDADNISRSQFWCDFNGERDPVTGMKPYRPLTDSNIDEAFRNLERTFVGNPYDGNGTPAREIGRRYFFNKYLQQERWQKRAEEFADFVWDHRRQIRDAGAGPMVTVVERMR
jgi:hypothetical protein